MNIPSAEECLFSVSEANRTLPLLRLVVGDIVEASVELQGLRERYESLREAEGLSADAMPEDGSVLYGLDEQLVLKMLAIQSFVKEVEEVGATVRDSSVGEIEFPSVLDGQEAFLSWRLKEDSIGFWRPSCEDESRLPLPAGVV